MKKKQTLICFNISAQNIDGSNEYLLSMFLSETKKNNLYPCKPQFYYIKVGFKRVKNIYICSPDAPPYNSLLTDFKIAFLLYTGPPYNSHLSTTARFVSSQGWLL